MPGKAIKSTNKKGGKRLPGPHTKSSLNGTISSSLNKKVADKQKEKEKRTKEKSKRTGEHDPDKTYEISEIGPIYLDWGKRRVKNSRGKIVREHYLKKDSKHRIWVKWADEFNDQYEKGNTNSRWSAESLDQFEGSGMKKIAQETLERKVVWPWPKIGDEGAESMLKILKTNGYKEWKNPKEKKDEKWRLDMPLEFVTDTSGLSSDDTDSTSGTEKEDEDENEEDEV